MAATDNKQLFMLSSFSAGMNRLMDATKLGEGEYPLLVNGRTRFNSIRPIKKTLVITGLPDGKIQGLYATVDWILVFVAGKAYYRNYAATISAFTEVAGLQLDPSVETIYAEAVPQARTLNVRKAVDASASNGIDISESIGGDASPACIICQDGTNQPWLILPDGSGRVTQGISQWITPDAREYVPIGTMMMYYNGVLYIVNGKVIYRSVSGRPLDFVIAIDTKGDKLASDGSTADKMAITIDYSTITALRALGAFDGAFFVSTIRQSYQVSPITDGSSSMIYGEPVFRNIPLFPTGALNQFSVVDLLGDTAIIDYAGIRSYNAVMQLRNTGKNSPFSAKIQALFTQLDGSPVVQTVSCATEFDNYALFAVMTVYGAAILVYDCIAQCWTGIDMYEDTKQIKYMAVVQTALTRKLLFVTVDNFLFEAFAHPTDFEVCSAYLGEFTSGDPRAELKPERLRLIFSEVRETGSVYAQIFSDRVTGIQHSEVLLSNNAPQTYPLELPFGVSTDDTEKNASFSLNRETTAWKHGFFVKWNFNASLSRLGFEASADVRANNLEQTAATEISSELGLPYITSYEPQAVIPTQIVRLTGRNFLSVQAIKLDNNYVSSFVLISNSSLAFTTPFLSAGTYIIRLVTATTEVEAVPILIIANP